MYQLKTRSYLCKSIALCTCTLIAIACSKPASMTSDGSIVVPLDGSVLQDATQSPIPDSGTPQTCGNGVLDPAYETCDDANLGGATCSSLGFIGGTLGCNPQCQYDVSSCMTALSGFVSELNGTKAGVLEARHKDLASGNWSAPEQIANIGAVAWIVHAVSPKDPTLEIAAVITTGTSNSVHLLHTSNGQWILDTSFAQGTLVGDADIRTLDVTVERSSGDPMVVYSNGTSSPKYRTFNLGTGWSAATSVFASPPGASKVGWVKLASRPGSDDIALTYSDGSGDVKSVLWNGTSWLEALSKKTLYSATGYVGKPNFSATYSTSGQLVGLVKFSCCTQLGEYYWNGNTQTWDTFPGGSPGAFGSDAVDIEALVGTERMVFTGSAGGVATWDGTDWSPLQSLPLGYGTSKSSAGAYLNEAEAIWVHNYDDYEMGRLRWARWTPLNGIVFEPPQRVPGLGNVLQVTLHTIGNGGAVIATAHDDAANLFAFTYASSTGWVQLGNTAVVNADLSATTTMPYSIALSP